MDLKTIKWFTKFFTSLVQRTKRLKEIEKNNNCNTNCYVVD